MGDRRPRRRRTDAAGDGRREDTARVIQLGIEYDPRPPLGPLVMDGLDGPAWAAHSLRTALSDHPALLTRLTT